MRTIYIADDGTQFDNSDDCEKYEFNLTISDHNLKLYDADGNLLDFKLTDSRAYNLADIVIVPDEASLNILHKVADWCGWCEWNRIDSIGEWHWKSSDVDRWSYEEKFVKKSKK